MRLLRKWGVVLCMAVLLVVGMSFNSMPNARHSFVLGAEQGPAPVAGFGFTPDSSPSGMPAGLPDGASYPAAAVSGGMTSTLSESSSATGGASGTTSGSQAGLSLSTGSGERPGQKVPRTYFDVFPYEPGPEPNSIYINRIGYLNLANYDEATYKPTTLIPDFVWSDGHVCVFVGHDWYKKPTYIAPGLQFYHCASGDDCPHGNGGTEKSGSWGLIAIEIDTPICPHTEYVWVVTKAATETAPGLRVLKCADTECMHTQTKEEIPQLSGPCAHSFGEWTLNYAPTETRPGMNTRECGLCGKKESKSIPMLNPHEHVWGGWQRTAYGNEHQVCQVCGVSGNSRPYVCTQHVWKDWKVLVAPTIHAVGMQAHECSDCGTIEYQNIPKLAHNPHNWGDWVVTMQPSVNGNGWQYHNCLECGASEGEVIPQLPPSPPCAQHSWAEWVVSAQPSTTQTGWHYHVCLVCGEQQGEDIPMLPPEEG